MFWRENRSSNSSQRGVLSYHPTVITVRATIRAHQIFSEAPHFRGSASYPKNASTKSLRLSRSAIHIGLHCFFFLWKEQTMSGSSFVEKTHESSYIYIHIFVEDRAPSVYLRKHATHIVYSTPHLRYGCGGTLAKATRMKPPQPFATLITCANVWGGELESGIRAGSSLQREAGENWVRVSQVKSSQTQSKLTVGGEVLGRSLAPIGDDGAKVSPHFDVRQSHRPDASRLRLRQDWWGKKDKTNTKTQTNK